MSNRPLISAAVITLNEEKNIKACIESLSWVDEIVIVDSLSTDNTKKIAETLGARVIDQSFLGHVRQKQYAVDACKHDWVICLDADERVTDSLREAILNLFQQPSDDLQKNGYSVARKSFHLGRWILHGGWYPDRNIRFFNRQYGRWSGVDPHDKIEVDGPIEKLNGELEHYVFRDLSHNVTQNNFFSTISARILADKKKRFSLFKLLFKPPGKFIETYLIKKGFLDGLPGFIISIGAAYSMFLKYAKLWELQQDHLNKDERNR